MEDTDDSQTQMDTEVIPESCQSDTEKAAEINHLSRQVTELQYQLKSSNEMNKQLRLLVTTSKEEPSIISEIQSNNKACNHYTGFPTFDRLMAVFSFFTPGKQGENIILYHSPNGKDSMSPVGRKRALSPIQGFILPLIRLRRGFSIKH